MVQWSQNLRKIVGTIMTSLPGTINVMACTMFFMVVYTVMGVQLFYDSEEFGRSSFVSFPVGMLTMFQCVTGEDWVDIMYAGMVTQPTIAPIFFISFYILVNFVLLNVIIAIICENFELGEEEKQKRQRIKFSEESAKLARKAMGGAGAQMFTDKLFRGIQKAKDIATEVGVLDPNGETDPLSPSSSTGLPLRALGGVASAGLGKLDSAAKKIDAAVLKEGPPVTNFYKQGGKLSDAELQQVQMLELLYDQMSPENLAVHAEDLPVEEKTCWVFTVEQREKLIWVAGHKNFERIVLAAIVFSCVLLMFDTPNPLHTHKWVEDSAVWFDIVFLVVFTGECVVKVIAFGFFSHQYVGDPWNIPDVVILVSMWLEFLQLLSFNLRAIRVIRPLRLLKRNKGMKVVLSMIGACVKPVANVLGLWVGFLLVYAILGVNLYAGQFKSCWGVEVGDDTVDVYGQADCVGSIVLEGEGELLQPTWENFGGEWYNFDNVGKSMVTLFEVASLEGWVDVMNGAMDTTSYGRQPEENFSAEQCIFFISFIVFGTFIIIELLVGVFVDSFYQAKGIGLLTEEQRKWYDLCNLIRAKHPKKVDLDEISALVKLDPGEEPPELTGFRRTASRLLASRWLINFFTACIAGNMLLLALSSYEVEWGGVPMKTTFQWVNFFFVTARARPGRLSGLSVFHRKSILYETFVWARRTLNRPKWRFLARAVVFTRRFERLTVDVDCTNRRSKYTWRA